MKNIISLFISILTFCPHPVLNWKYCFSIHVSLAHIALITIKAFSKVLFLAMAKCDREPLLLDYITMKVAQPTYRQPHLSKSFIFPNK